MAPGGMPAAATYGNEGAASRRCRRHPMERLTAPPKGLDQQREKSATFPHEAEVATRPRVGDRVPREGVT
jgi:hypothetical protein